MGEYVGEFVGLYQREVRFAIDGHGAKDVGDRYGSEGYGTSFTALCLPFNHATRVYCSRE